MIQHDGCNQSCQINNNNTYTHNDHDVYNTFDDDYDYDETCTNQRANWRQNTKILAICQPFLFNALAVLYSLANFVYFCNHNNVNDVTLDDRSITFVGHDNNNGGYEVIYTRFNFYGAISEPLRT